MGLVSPRQTGRKEVVMNIKLMLAGVVGYLLGRLKKGKAALKFALWAGGRDTHVKDLVRAQATLGA